jgi:hypothetical protein
LDLRKFEFTVATQDWLIFLVADEYYLIPAVFEKYKNTKKIRDIPWRPNLKENVPFQKLPLTLRQPITKSIRNFEIIFSML